MLLNVLAWAVFGLIAGAVAKFILPGRDPGGVLITILLGVAGALLGGFLSSQLFNWDVSGFNLPSFAIAIVGALLLLCLYRFATGGRSARRAL